MNRHVIWHGTQQESAALLRAIERLCTGEGGEGDRCSFGMLGQRLSTCAAHSMLRDQRALNGLIWMRRMAPRLMREEETPAGQPA
jgi:hypothetical protein